MCKYTTGLGWIRIFFLLLSQWPTRCLVISSKLSSLSGHLNLVEQFSGGRQLLVTVFSRADVANKKYFIIKFSSSPFSLTKIEELTAGSDETHTHTHTHTAQPHWDSNQGLANANRTLWPLSYETATGTACEFSPFTKLPVLFLCWRNGRIFD